MIKVFFFCIASVRYIYTFIIYASDNKAIARIKRDVSAAGSIEQTTYVTQQRNRSAIIQNGEAPFSVLGASAGCHAASICINNTT